MHRRATVLRAPASFSAGPVGAAELSAAAARWLWQTARGGVSVCRGYESGSGCSGYMLVCSVLIVMTRCSATLVGWWRGDRRRSIRRLAPWVVSMAARPPGYTHTPPPHPNTPPRTLHRPPRSTFSMRCARTHPGRADRALRLPLLRDRARSGPECLIASLFSLRWIFHPSPSLAHTWFAHLHCKI